MQDAQPSQRVSQPARIARITVGEWEKHDVEVSYGRALHILRIRIDGKTAYQHCDRLPWAERRARDFKTPGREAHTFVVEPPGAPAAPSIDSDAYRLWLDGKLLLRIQRR